VDPETMKRILDEMALPDSALGEVPFLAAIAQAMTKIPRSAVPDLPDRMIAATALHLNVPLVTADAQIRASGIATIW